jgi:glycosyltransferase involved in cell wall biosynthesis
MRVLFVTHDAYLYGANRSLLNLIDGLGGLGVTPHVVVPRAGELAAALTKRRIPFAVLPLAMWMGRSRLAAPYRLARNLALLPRLIRLVRQWEIEVIYTNSSVTPLGAWAAALARVPHVWHVREFGDRDYGLRHDWGRRCFESWMHRSSAVIAISHAVRAEVLQGARRDVHVIWNGVTDREGLEILRNLGETLAQQSPRASGSYVFVSAGALIPRKGHEEAIRGFTCVAGDYPDAKLLVMGSGSSRYVERLKALSEALGISEQVEFTGYLPNPFVVYLKADAVLVCSHHEALGRVAQEAMACGKPVVGNRSGGLTEIVQHEETGLLYTGGQAELAHCMRRLLDAPSWGRALGEAGRRRAERHFLIEDCAARIAAVLERVAATPPTTPASTYVR